MVIDAGATTIEAAPQVLALLPTPRATQLVAQMAEDRAADVLATIGDAAAPILDGLSPEGRHSLAALLARPAAAAAGMMIPEYVAMPASATVAETLDHIRPPREPGASHTF